MARGKLNRGHETSRRVRVGVVLLLGAAILMYGIYQVGSLFDVFASRYPLITLVGNSAGLTAGAPVTLAGQRVGQVSEIRFIPVERRAGDANVVVRLSVNEGVRDQIRRDSRAALRTQGLLGDRYIDIAPGSPESPPLRPGDTLPTEPALDYEEVLRTAASTLDQVQAMVGDLQVMTGQMASGQGTIGALLQDDRLYQQMTSATGELARLLRTVNRSDGTLARLIRDPTLYGRMDATLARLDSITATILAGEGSLGRLVQDDSLYRGLVGVVGHADSTLAGMSGLVAGMNNGQGTLSRLLADPSLYDQLLKAVVDLQNLIEGIRADPKSFRPEVKVDVFD